MRDYKTPIQDFDGNYINVAEGDVVYVTLPFKEEKVMFKIQDNKLNSDLYVIVQEMFERKRSINDALEDIETYIQANYLPISKVKEAVGEDYVFERPKDDYLPNVYQFLKGKNELRHEILSSLGLEEKP